MLENACVRIDIYIIHVGCWRVFALCLVHFPPHRSITPYSDLRLRVAAVENLFNNLIRMNDCVRGGIDGNSMENVCNSLYGHYFVINIFFLLLLLANNKSNNNSNG